jgi:K+-sensing histidine kinase KdpD
MIKTKVRTMRISSNLLTSFLHDLVDWTHIKLGHFKKKVASFDIQETFRDIIKMMKFKADMKQVYCRLEIDEDMPQFVQGDQQRLVQLMVNLMQNALKFTFSGGVVVKLNYHTESMCLYCEVSDTGEGISKEKQEDLFKLFTYDGKKRQNSTSGIGMGLCICRAIVEQFNGKINFVSEPGIGTTFMFTFQLDFIITDLRVI